MPTSSNIVDIAIDREQIVLVEGVEPGILFRKPPGMVLQTLYTYIPGSDSYQEAEFEMEVENDTVVYFNFAFDTSGWELPVAFELALAPIDDTGTPVDAFVVPVVVVETTDYSSGCSNPFADGPLHFYWRYRKDLNTNEHIYNGQVISYPTTPTGCCGPNGSYFHGCDPKGNQAQEINAVIKSWEPELESITFYPDGTVTGYLLNKGSRNIDQINSDYCNLIPTYLPETRVDNVYSGTYTFNPNDCTITIDQLTGQVEAVYSEFSGDYIGDWPKYIGAGFGSGTTYQIEDFELNFPPLGIEIFKKNDYLYERRNNPETGQPESFRCWINTDGADADLWFSRARKYDPADRDGLPTD